MPSLGLTLDELLGYTEGERDKWRAWLSSRPEALEVTLQRDGRYPTVASIVDHIFIFHILIHETRHWAQVALALRNAGYDLPGDHDFFYTNALD